MTQDMSNKILTRFSGIKMRLRLFHHEILASLRWQASKARATARARRDSCVPAVASEQSSSDGSCPTRLRLVGSKLAELERRLVASLLLMMVLGVSVAWAEPTGITSLSSIGSSGEYIITDDIDATGFSSSIASFSGTLEAAIDPATHMPYRIKNLSAPLFTTLTGTVKNLVIENVTIEQAGQVGAIACIATGTARIYNCGILGGSVKSTGTSTADDATDCCGGLVGLLDGNSNESNAPRVINCYSYADIKGGNRVGGIVGYNNYSTNKNNRRSMVFCCMFYGDITGCTNKAPIYNGKIISNKDDTGVSNFNYFRAEASFAQKLDIQTANCALMAETRFLQRFEFFRHLLNGHRELAAWWVTGNVADKDKMLKWVMEPSQIGSATPYPILKEQGQYPSVVNYAPSDVAIDDKNEHRNEGRKLTNMGTDGKLSVTIEMGSGGEQFAAPTGASITGSPLSLTITDKDPDHFNFNYGKVQLPYYNDVGTKNYHKASDSDNTYRVVVGWKITSITGGTPGTLSIPANDNTPADAPYYNYADRNCTNKDLYSVSGRVFNQGDYWDVPEGVTAITIQPYWAKAAYVADEYRDVVYNEAMSSKKNVGTVAGGKWFTNSNSHEFTFKGEKLSLTVYSEISNAVTALSINNSHTVNDYAVVLVGNHHYYNGGSNKAIGGSKVPYTVTSADFDCDNEPDYSLIMRCDGRAVTHPVKYDFLCMPGFGMAQKSTGGNGSYNFGIPKPDGWFEVTNTALFRVTQMEYSPSTREKKPIILHGGVIEQWVSSQGASGSGGDAGDRTSYFHMGDNVWFKEFHIGVHQDYKNPTPHPPVSVTGGDYDEFALTGLYRADANHYNDNAECYINGGRFGKVYGAGREGIGHATNKTNGNITWQIDNADMDEFYGGGINFAHTAQGSISTTISNSHVGIFCGGPKFGDMNVGKTVVTNATNCTFGTYFGAGYGGNSYNRQIPKNYSGNTIFNIPWNDWINGTASSPDNFTGYKQEYSSSHSGVSTQINYQFLPMSGNVGNVARLFVEYVGFSLATTRNVTSNLTGCTITDNFYGGGNLGSVNGPVTSTLTNCIVEGNVFGAGFSASLPTVEVDSIGFRTEPYFYTDFGTYRTGVKGKTTTYTWQHANTVNNTSTAIDKTNHILYTTEDLTKLGTVTGDVTLNILGNDTHIKGDVYGGGAKAKTNSEDNTNKITVNLLGGTIDGSAYGGGLGSLGVKNASDPTKYDENPVAADVGNTILNLNGVNYSTDNATQTLYTSWGLVKDETSTGTPYVVDDTNKGCIVKGNIFGCNNLNGTPKGSATVHIYKTQNADASQIINSEASGDKPAVSNAKVSGQYDVKAVYGGGNLAPYVPNGPSATATNDDHKNTTQTTNVIIDGCDRTSIGQVYGGGNAASTPATKVNVYGTYEIGELFGGGNGKDKITVNNVLKDNPGANVGYEEYADDATNAQTPDDREDNYGYGSGKAEVNIYGGKIHSIYGGSNTKGNVRRIAVAMLEELQANGKPICHFDVDEAYGGGKSATMDGEAHLEMKCIPGMTAAYGGAENADIQNNVTLNITNGKFGQVFGGNNFGGRIMGSITVNIEETGCRPVIIGELYGGGNRASYSVYGYKEEKDEDDNIVYDDFGKIKWQPLVKGETGALSETAKYGYPQVNVKSFTSIGEVYGGGYGTSATMVGDPHVNINVVLGDQRNHTEANIATEGTLTIIDETEDHLETTREVNYPTHTKGNYIGAIRNVFGGGNAAKVIGDTYVNIGTAEKIDYVTKGSEDTDPRTGITVVGADIRGNVYGGGNKADVSGKTNVTIGKQQTTTP